MVIRDRGCSAIAYDGGFPGGQAEYVRVPFADVGPLKVPDHLADEQVLFLSDIFPTGYMAAENCDIQAKEIRSPSGAAGRSASSRSRARICFGAEKVVLIDHYPDRLELAAAKRRTWRRSISTMLMYTTNSTRLRAGAVRTAASTRSGWRRTEHSPDAIYDRVKTAIFLATDRAHALRQAIYCCRKGGTVSIPGVYGGFLDKIQFRGGIRQGTEVQDGADEYAFVYAAAACGDRGRKNRPEICYIAPALARRGAGGLR